MRVDKDLASSVAVVMCSLFGAALLSRVARTFRVPPVLPMLGCGMMLRQIYRSSDVIVLTRPFLDIALAAVGVDIGSHLNQATIGPHKAEVMKFILLFVPCVVAVMLLAVRMLFPPQLFPYGFLIGSIAVERSSPECLFGVEIAKSSGAFTAVIVCIAAMQDIAALVCFVITTVFLGATDVREAVAELGGLFLTTALASIVAIGVAKAVKEPVMALTAVVFILSVASEHTRSELLLSAVVTGVVLNYTKKHPLMGAISESQGMVSVLLFTLMGYRIDIATYVGGGLFAAGVLFVARIAGLYCGSVCGGYASGLTPHIHVRWMGLVTQLAIALSLVERTEALFPQAAPLAVAMGGAVLGGLLCGPPLLQHVLHRVGDAGKADDDDGTVV